ncbi:MAG: hypothetical protein P8M07_00325 [Flavobacteriales bacterium]|nr:hypothetical protein [Flavobacteriales bacterium]
MRRFSPIPPLFIPAIFIAFALPISFSAQGVSSSSDEPLCISTLRTTHGLIMATPSAERTAPLLAVGEQLRTCIDELGAFSPALGELGFMGAVTSDDRKLRVWTWNAPQDDRTCLYAGLIAHQDLEPAGLLDLAVASSSLAPETQATYGAENWPGALYYDILPVKEKSGAYLLLGWDAGDGAVTRKLVEPLTVGDQGRARFGAPLFDGFQQRFMLEFNDQVQVTLRHEPRKKRQPERIVFDHLAPRADHLEGVAAFYGPDLSFDAWVRHGKGWTFKRDVTVTQNIPDGRRFIDPRQAP